MRAWGPLSTLVHVVMAAMWLVLSGTLAAHQGAHPTPARIASPASSTPGLEAEHVTDARSATNAIGALAPDYVAPAPSCPGGAGGGCCCGSVVGAVPTQLRINARRFAVLDVPLPAWHRHVAFSSSTPLPAALVFAATHGARAPPALL